MKRLVLIALLLIGGCGAGYTTSEVVPVAVPVPVLMTNMDVLRVICWFADDALILAGVAAVDDMWYTGMSYSEFLVYASSGCNGDCLACLEATGYFVYFILH